MLGYCWGSVCDAALTVTQHWTNVSCLPGMYVNILICSPVFVTLCVTFNKMFPYIMWSGEPVCYDFVMICRGVFYSGTYVICHAIAANRKHYISVGSTYAILAQHWSNVNKSDYYPAGDQITPPPPQTGAPEKTPISGWQGEQAM